MHKIFKKEGAHGQLNHPLGEASTYSQHGITHTLDQVFEASSDLVKLALADNSAIHVTYVGSRWEGVESFRRPDYLKTKLT